MQPPNAGLIPSRLPNSQQSRDTASSPQLELPSNGTSEPAGALSNNGASEPAGALSKRANVSNGEPEPVGALSKRANVIIGTPALLHQHGISTVGEPFQLEAERLQTEAKTVLWVAVNGKTEGLIAVADTLKPEAKEAVAELRSLGCKVTMMTGDNRVTAAAIAQAAGIDDVMAELLPEDKASAVKKRQTGTDGFVAMVGDGINDAPALAQADVGMALGTGTDIAMETADLTLMHGELRAVPEAIRLSRGYHAHNSTEPLLGIFLQRAAHSACSRRVLSTNLPADDAPRIAPDAGGVRDGVE